MSAASTLTEPVRSVDPSPTGRDRRPARVLATVLRGFGYVAAGVLVWAFAARVSDVPFLFPGPREYLTELVRQLGTGEIFDAVGASLVRIYSGWTLGSLGGILLGLLFGYSRIVRGLTAPLVTLFRFVPPLAWYAPVLAWLGAGESSKVVLIVYTSVFVVALSTMTGESQVPLNLRRMARTSGARWYQTLVQVSLPASVPHIFAGVRIAMGNAFMTVVTAEMLGAAHGLGAMITNGMTTLNIAEVFVAMSVLGLFGLVTDRLLVLVMNTVGLRFRGARPTDVA